MAAQDGEAVLRAVLASQRPDRCKRAQAFLSTQGLEPDTVAELVAEEVTRELLTASEGTGALPGRPPQPLRPHSQVPSSKEWGVTLLCLPHTALWPGQVALVGRTRGVVVVAFRLLFYDYA